MQVFKKYSKLFWKYERTREFWVFKSILEVYVFKQCEGFYRNDVWFESKVRVMVGIRKSSDLNQEAKTIWNQFLWFESVDLKSKKPVIRIRVLEGFPFQFDSNQEILWVESDCCELNQTFMWFKSWILEMKSWALWVCFKSEKFWNSNHIGKISFSQNLKSFFRFYYDHDSNHSQK